MAWHSLVNGSGTKDDSVFSQLPVLASRFLRSFDLTVLQTEGLVVSQHSERRTLVTQHEPHNSVHGKQTQDLKEQLQKIPVLRFVLSTSKSVVFPHP